MASILHPVSPADIQRELDRIWESLETKNVARASLFNLIFYTQKNPRSTYIQKIAQKVVEKFPSRVIFVTIDKDAREDFLKTEVSILSSSKGEFDVACDYIQIQASGSSHERVPFVVLPHILTDLPVYLVWGEDPCQKDPLCGQLEQLANRLIVDSEATSSLPKFASSLIEHHERAHCDIADLNWARIESWREMLSIAFHSKGNLEQMQRSQKITISYNSQETPFFCHTQIQSVYLQGWLACQLGWQFLNLRKENNTLLFSYQTTTGPVEIALSTFQLSNLPPGLILSVEVSTREGELHAKSMRAPLSLYLYKSRVGPLACQRNLSSRDLGAFPQSSQPHEKNGWFKLLLIENLKSRSLDDRREIIIPGDYAITVIYCVEHFIALSKRAIQDHGAFFVALSGGSTPKALFEHLASATYFPMVEWDKIHVFWSDERAVPPDHPESNYHMAVHAGLLKGIPKEHIHRMRAEENIEKNADSYEQEIAAALQGRNFDLVMLGMGEDGHTASLFPHTEGLKCQNRLVIANYIPDKKIWRMTLTYDCINAAHHSAIYVLGASKKTTLAKVLLSSNQFEQYPVQKVGTPTHPALWIVDQDAAEELITKKEEKK
jgi:6-phosphogluconolactonase